MLTEEKRNEIAKSLNQMTWAALNKYEALKKQGEALTAQGSAAWGVYLSASQAEVELHETPYLATDELFGDFVVNPTKSKAETSSVDVEIEAQAS